MISVIELDESQRELWDRELARFPMAHPLNAFGWARVREIDGWSAVHLIAKRNGEVTGAGLLLIRKLPILPLSIMYAPRGFVFDLGDTETLEALVDSVRARAQQVRAIFLRIDPHIPEAATAGTADPFAKVEFEHLPHRWSYWNAPCDVYRTDLTSTASEDELFEQIDPKARTGIRKAKKEGVSIRPAESLDEARAFYAVYSKFAVEKGFLFRDFRYHERLWEEFISRGQGVLLLSLYDGAIIGGAICLAFGDLCVEMHRGVVRDYQNLRVNEALVWEGMLWAKRNDHRWYCQRGVGAGPLQKFKEKFRPQRISLVGYYDLPFRPLLYRAMAFVEFKLLPKVVTMLMRVRRSVQKLRLS